MSAREIQFDTEYDPDFKVQFIEGVVGSLNANGGRMTFFIDLPLVETGNIDPDGHSVPELSVKKIRRTFLIDIRMSSENYRSIASWMKNNVDNYDKMLQSGVKPIEIQTPFGYQ